MRVVLKSAAIRDKELYLSCHMTEDDSNAQGSEGKGSSSTWSSQIGQKADERIRLIGDHNG